jgi:acetylornithine deacetylase/succinyl-diaminopimelate desuccinylase-like protein
MAEQFPERTSRVKKDIETLCKDGHRGTCSIEELRAAEWMGKQLEEFGLNVTLQRFSTPRTFGSLVLIHVVVALLAAALIPCCPIWSVLILGLTIYSFYGEASARFHILRRVLPQGISQNVIGHYKPEQVERTIIFGGHLDSAQAGLIFHPRLTANATGSMAAFGPLFPTFAAMLLLALIAIVRAFDGGGWLLDVLDWIAVVVLIITAALMVQWMLAKPVPGANDNASGIAATLEMARTLMAKKPERTELVFVGFGAEEANLSGSIAFVNEFGHRYDKDKTFVLNFDGIAAGAPYFVTGEMLNTQQRYVDQELIVLTRSLARSPQTPTTVAPALIQGHTDALPFGHAGFKAVSLVGLEKNGVPLNYHGPLDAPELMPYDFTEQTLLFADSIVAALRT